MNPIRKAVIHAAGFRARFLLFTRTIPKELAPVKPVLPESAAIRNGGKDAAA